MEKRAKEKPLGMRIGENVFCIGYLVFVLIAGVISQDHLLHMVDSAVSLTDISALMA